MANTPSPTAVFDRVQVRGSYVGLDGSAITGSVTFTPRAARLTDTADLVTIIGRAFTVQLSSSGTFSVLLPATDDPDIATGASGFTYQVIENFVGGDTYDIQVPIAAAATGVDISTVPRTTTVTPVGPLFVTTVQLDALSARVDAVAGYVSVQATKGTSYTLTQTDSGTLIPISSANPVTITVPALAKGSTVELVRLGTGTIILAASSVSLTIPTGSSASPRVQGSSMSLLWLSTASVLVGGDLT